MVKESSIVHTVKIFVGGRRYKVPSDKTILQAMEHVGYKFVRGSGCRGGFCGACTAFYRIRGKRRLETALACQKIVEDEMHVVLIPPSLGHKASYDVTKLRPTHSVLLEHYPEIAKCLSCNTCTKACPQELEVMDYVQAAVRGDIEEVAKLSFECIECGLCGMRCPAEISPNYVARLSRRLYSKYISKTSNPLAKRVKEIEEGAFDSKLERYTKMDVKKLKKLYAELQGDQQL